MDQGKKSGEKNYWWIKEGDASACAADPGPGSRCPNCLQGVLRYDGLFVLGCAKCGYVASSGGFT